MDAEPVWITESEVVELVDLAMATGAVRSALALEHEGRAQTMEKTSLVFGDGDTLHALGGEVGGPGLVGVKTWAHTGGGATPLLVLWDSASGALRAVVEAFALGQLRTAAVAAVATDHLAAPHADTLALIGTGKQAFAQAAAVASVRTLATVSVFSPMPEHRAAMVDRLRAAGAAAQVLDSASVEEAVAVASIITTVTRARTPFLGVGMLAKGAHVNAMGAISPERAELAGDLGATAALVVSDSPDTARRLSRELDGAPEIVSLAAVVAGRTRPDGLSVFKSMGIGLADVAIGSAMLTRAAAVGAGRPFPHPERVAPHLFGGGRR